MQPWLAKGYLIRSRFPEQVELVRRKQFSLLSAFAWFLFCGVGVLLYVIYYLVKGDDIVVLTGAQGRIETRNASSSVNTLGTIVGVVAWGLGALLGIGLLTGVGAAFSGPRGGSPVDTQDVAAPAPEEEEAEQGDVPSPVAVEPEEPQQRDTDVRPTRPGRSTPIADETTRREIAEVCSRDPDRYRCARLAERHGLCPDARTPDERRQCIEVKKMLAAQGLPLFGEGGGR